MIGWGWFWNNSSEDIEVELIFLPGFMISLCKYRDFVQQSITNCVSQHLIVSLCNKYNFLEIKRQDWIWYYLQIKSTTEDQSKRSNWKWPITHVYTCWIISNRFRALFSSQKVFLSSILNLSQTFDDPQRWSLPSSIVSFIWNWERHFSSETLQRKKV